MCPCSHSLSLRFFSDAIGPSEIAGELGMIAKISQTRGDQRRTPKGAALDGVYAHSYCTFDIPLLPGESLEDTIQRFCGEFQGRRGIFVRVAASGGRCELFVGWFVARNSGATLSRQLLEELASLKLDLALDIYPEAEGS